MTAKLAALALSVMSACVGALTAIAQRGDAKPRVPPGADPGGVAIAVIGRGIDYTLPHIAARLARDGEGEIIGWDFLDDDRRPFAPCSADGLCTLPETMQRNTVRARLVVMRAEPHTPRSLVEAVRRLSQMPVPIAYLSTDPALPLAFFQDAAHRFPGLVFVGLADRLDKGPDVTRGGNFAAFHAGDPQPLLWQLAACAHTSPGLQGAALLACASPLEGDRAEQARP